MAKNTYDPALARKGWLHLVDAAHREIKRQCGPFPATPATRRHVADRIAQNWENEHIDEYNAMHDRMDNA